MMLQDGRVCAAAVKDWAWTLNNPTAEVEEGLHRLLDLHCAYWVYGRELGQQGNPPPPPPKDSANEKSKLAWQRSSLNSPLGFKLLTFINPQKHA